MEQKSNLSAQSAYSPPRELFRSVSLAVCAIVSAGIVILVCLAAFAPIAGAPFFCEGCDSFTYMTMAQDLRQARATGQPAHYFLQDDHTRFLIETLKRSPFPPAKWDEMVAPHGFHYFPGTDQVAPMYPLGTPWELSLFPKWDANRLLKVVTLAFTAMAGLALVAWCWWRGLSWSCAAAPLVVWVYVGGFLHFDAFSIDATLVPLAVSVGVGWIALEWRNRGGAIVAALLSGIFMGQVMQDRIGSVLLAPCMALIFLPRRAGLFLCYSAGVIINGILPLLLHARAITGSYFLPTYNQGDTAQSLASIRPNLSFYAGCLGDTGLPFFLGLVLMLAVLGGIVRASAKINWRAWMWDHAGALAAPAAAILVTIAFFLIHHARQPYYPFPGVLLGCTLLICLCMSVESRALRPGDRNRALAAALAAVFALAGAAGTEMKLGRSASEGLTSLRNPVPWTPVSLSLPSELQAADAWIWADRLSGSVRYYDQRPGFKIFFGPPEPRRLVFDAVRAKGDPQYVIGGSEVMEKMMAEARSWGWRFTLVGYAQRDPCYRMDK